MNRSAERTASEAVDAIQEQLTNYAYGLNYGDLSPQAIHAAKVRVIDTLGALVCGFFGEPCRIARNVAAQISNANGATIIGTRRKTTPDMAAFVNGTTARYPELTDTYHWPGSFGGHPSDVVTPVLAAAEYAQVSGREFIMSVVLAYEVCLRVNDLFHNHAFDHTNLGCLGVAVAAGKLFGLSRDQLAHCISIASVPNIILRQVRLGGSSMCKAVATGYAGRAALFAALLARAGMKGPYLPFEGTAGWCKHVAREHFSLKAFGGHGTPFKILDTRIKSRPAAGGTLSSILAAEKIAPLKRMKQVKQITIEVYRKAKEGVGTDERAWNPTSKEAADHSIPYLVAVTLMDGTVTPRWYNADHLWNPEVRVLMQKTTVIENEEFTKANERLPVVHRTRVTVVTDSGDRLVGESGGDDDDLSTQRSDTQIEEKFRGLSQDFLDAKRVNEILDRLWRLENVGNVAEIPPAFVLD